MNEFNDIQKTLQEIEPPSGAKERMLANIRAKAQNSEKDEASKATIDEEITVTKEEKKAIRWKYIMQRVALPLAAGLVAAVFLLIRNIPKEPITEGQNPSGDLYTSPYTDVSSVSELESLLQIPFSIPSKASEVLCSVFCDQVGYISFTMEDHYYDIAGSKERADISDIYGTLLEEEIIDSEYNATLATYDADGLTVYYITWSDGVNYYSLTNRDGCTKEDIEAVYFER